MSIIWPWAASAAIEKHKAEAVRLAQELKEANVRYIVAKSDINKLASLLAEAHFRDPKTGRLGKRGQRP